MTPLPPPRRLSRRHDGAPDFGGPVINGPGSRAGHSTPGPHLTREAGAMVGNLQSSIHLDPSHTFRVRDDVDEHGNRTALVSFAALTIYAPTWLGDAAIVASTGALIDALEQLRRNARQRIAAEHTGMPVPTDGLEPATLAEATQGWAPGELTEAYGS